LFPQDIDGVNLRLIFRPILHAQVLIGQFEEGQGTELRRISTESYKEGDSGTETFKTQWRWYWQDDYRMWQLFDKVCFCLAL